MYFLKISLLIVMIVMINVVVGSNDNNDKPSESIINPFLNDDMIEPVEELNIEEPYLWQMAAFAARQMSDKRIKYKLMELTSAEKIDTIYRLRVTLKKIFNTDYDAKNNVLYCTVEVNNDGQQLEMENFGCTIPAMIRVRDRNMEKSDSSNSNSVDKIQTNEYDAKQQQQPSKYQPINNVIPNEKTIDPIEFRKEKLQQTFSSPFLYRQPTIFTRPQMFSYYQPRSTYTYQEVRPNYRFYY